MFVKSYYPNNLITFNKSKKEYFCFLFFVLSLFVIGLSIPNISYILIYICFFIVLIKWNRKIINDFIGQCYLLLMFSALYFYIMYLHGFMELGRVIGLVFFYPIVYAFGYSIGRSNTPNWPYGLKWLIFAFISGCVIISFISITNVVFNQNAFMYVPGRIAPSIWSAENGEEAALLFDSYASLGMCLFPLLFFCKENGINKYLLFVIVIILVSIGVYVDIALRFRTPIFAMTVSFFLSLIYFFKNKNEKTSYKLRTFSFLSLFIGLLIYLLYNTMIDFSNFKIIDRLFTEGIDTPRYSVQLKVIESLPNYWLGGRQLDLGYIMYAHNLWLDIAYDAGIFPVLFLLFFHFNHFRSIVFVIRSRLPMTLSILIICVSISFLFAFLKQPIMEGMRLYFGISCFYFGLIRRLVFDVKAISCVEKNEIKNFSQSYLKIDKK